MSAPFAAAFDAIEEFIRSILPRAGLTRVGDESLWVSSSADRIRLTFSRGQLDDFQLVLAGNQPRPYSQGIRHDLHYPIYVALGREGMIPDLRIFSLLLNAKDRDWLRSCRLSETTFSAEYAKALYDDLIELQSSLQLTLRSDVEIPEVSAELKLVESLTDFYMGTLIVRMSVKKVSPISRRPHCCGLIVCR
jgi:hypothetical protein